VTVTDANGCSASPTVALSSPPALITSTAVTSAPCNGGTGSGTLSVSGGTSPYTYTWSPSGGNAATASGLAAGTYTIAVKDANNCSSIKTLDVTEPAALAATVSYTGALCQGGNTGMASVQPAGGTGPYTYTWAPSGGNAATATGLTAGNYTVTLRDANACSVSRTVSISEPSALSAIASRTNASCAGPDGIAAVAASGGTGAYTYTWSPSGGNAAVASGLGPGSYTATVRDAKGCSYTATVSITQPVAGALAVTASSVLCHGGTGSATVAVSGGLAPYTYTWSPAGGNATTAPGLAPGIYTVSFTDANACLGTRTLSITQPASLTATATQTNVACQGANNGIAAVSVAGGNSPYTYTWSPSGGNAASASSLAPGVYTVAVQDANLCGISQSYTITEPAALTAVPGQTNVSCNGASTGAAAVTASGGTAPYTYTWMPSGGNASGATSLAAGNYTVTVRDAQLCLLTQTFSITQPPALNGAISQNSISCYGLSNGSASVAATGGVAPYTYTWSPSGGNASTAAGLGPGVYTLSLADANACLSTRTLSITQPASLTATATQTNATCQGANNGIASISVGGGIAPYTYTWSPSGGNAASASGLTPGVYTVAVRDANLCGISQSYTITEPAALMAVPGQTNVSCFSFTNGAASVAVSGGTLPYTYTWSPAGGNASAAAGLAAGNYTVSVRDAQLCLLTYTFSITQPPALNGTISQSSITCYGFSNGSASVAATGGVAPYTYTWSPSGGNAAAATGLPAGTYTLALLDANNCSNTATVAISQPSQFTVSAVSASVACNGQSTGSGTVSTAGATAPYTYTWSPSGGNAATATGLAAGTYSVAIRDAQQCAASVTLSVSEPPPLAAVMSHTDVTCYGSGNGVAVMSASGGVSPYTYTWSPTGGNAATATGLVPGTYSVSLRDANACSISRTVSIGEAPQFTITVASSSITCNGLSNGSGTVSVSGATPAYAYTWSPSGGNGATASGLGAGTYSVQIRDANGCSRTQTLTVSQPAPVSSAVSYTDVSCYGFNNGFATVTAGGGVGAYTYTWTPSGLHSATVSGLSPAVYTVTTADANLCMSTRTVLISQPGSYTLSVSAGSVLCNGQSTGTGSVAVSGNTAPYTYTWSPSGGNGAAASGLAAGTYSVAIRDAHNCPASQTLTILQPAALSGSMSTAAANCGNADGTATVSVSGGQGSYTYTWSPAGGNAAVSAGIPAGTYTCAVRDANNCSLALSGVVAVINPSVSLAATAGSVCAGLSTTLSATGSNTYTWSPSLSLSSANGSTVAASPATSTIYTVTGANAYGCTVTNTISVQAFANPVLALSVTSASVCAGQSSTLSASGANTYTWSPPTGLANANSGTTTATPPGTQVYSVTAADTRGCLGTGSVSVGVWTLPPVSASAGPATVCANEPSVLTAAGAVSYTWSSGSTANPYTVNPSVSNTYTVTGQDANGCRNTSTLAVAVNQPPTVGISGSTVVCLGGTVTLTASGAASYTWTNGVTGPSLTTSPGGTSSYTVIGADSNGCRDTSAFTVTVYVAPTLSITGKDRICEGDQLTLTASGGSNGYAWSTGDNTASITYPYTSNALVTVSSGTAPCIGTATFVINVDPLPVVTATASPGAIILGQAAQLNGTGNGTQYQWQPETGLSCTSCSNPVAHPPATTIYTLMVTDANGCRNYDTVRVFVEMICGEVFAPSAFSPNDDGNNDTWCVYGNCIRFLQCDIFNRWGQKVYTIMDKNDCWDGRVNGVVQNSGVYIYQLTAGFVNGETHTQKGNFTLVR